MTLTFLIRFLTVLSLVKSISNILVSPIELVILALANKKDDGNVRGSMPTRRILCKYPSTTGDTNQPDFRSET